MHYANEHLDELKQKYFVQVFSPIFRLVLQEIFDSNEE